MISKVVDFLCAFMHSLCVLQHVQEYKIIALYYLAFIHEVEYEVNSTLSWIDIEKSPWAKGRVVELNGYFVEGKQEPVWEVVSYNGLNEDNM